MLECTKGLESLKIVIIILNLYSATSRGAPDLTTPDHDRKEWFSNAGEKRAQEEKLRKTEGIKIWEYLKAGSKFQEAMLPFLTFLSKPIIVNLWIHWCIPFPRFIRNHVITKCATRRLHCM